MYHQFDRSMHPRQSILKTILTLRENSSKAESSLQALKSVSSPVVLYFSHLLSVLNRSLLFCRPLFGVQKLQQLGVTPLATAEPPPTREQHPRSNPLPPRPSSLILGAPINHKEVQRLEEDEEEEIGEEATEVTDTERTVEGSSGTESCKQSYEELEGTYDRELAKEEPAVVSLEFGVARMTC